MAEISSIFERYSLLKQIPVFSHLNWFDLQKIARKTTLVDYQKGDIICKQGDPPDAFYCLISGRVQAYVPNAPEEHQEVEFIRRGMYFGIISLLTGENHSLSFKAINDSVVLKINKNDFHSLLNLIPQLGMTLSQSLSRRLRSRAVHSKTIFESTIISIYSPVKGSGASTLAINLALNLKKETDKKVILININTISRQASCVPGAQERTTPCWKKPALELKEILKNEQRIMQHIARGDLPVDLLNVKFDPSDPALVSQISHFVTAFVSEYHYVVVDLPSEMDEVVLKTLTQSDIVYLISMNRPEDLSMTRQVIKQLREILKESFSSDKLCVLSSNRDPEIVLTVEEINKEIDFPVLFNLPLIGPSELVTPQESAEISVTLPQPESEYAKMVTKIARKIGGVLVGLVLGGGAALGYAHIGVMRVLEEEKIPVDILAGSSMGALMATMWASGYKADEIAVMAKEFAVPQGIQKLLDPIFPISGLIGGRSISRWLHKKLGTKTFHDTRIPLKVIAYDLSRRQDIVIESGLLAEAVRRSTAIPGMISPIVEPDRVVIDGGALNPLPTNVLAGMGIHKIIAVNVLQSPQDVTQGYLAEQQRIRQKEKIRFTQSPWAYIRFRLEKHFRVNIYEILVGTFLASEYVIAQQSGQQADVMIHPDLAGMNWMDVEKADDFIRLGEEAARKALPAIRQLLKE